MTMREAKMDRAVQGSNSSTRVSKSAVVVYDSLEDYDELQQPTNEEGHEWEKNRGVNIASVLRRLIVVLFLGFGIVFPFLTYKTLREIETQSFRLDFEALSVSVVSGFETKVSNMLGGLDTLSMEATSFAIDNNLTWPMVTLNDFDYRGGAAVSIPGIIQAGFYPLVTNETRAAWEKYSAEAIDWMWKALKRQNLPIYNIKLYQSYTSLDLSQNFIGQIFASDSSVKFGFSADTTEGPYFINWQSFPLSQLSPNFNLRSTESDRESLDVMAVTRRTVIGQIAKYAESEQASAYGYFTDLIKKKTRNESALYQGEPLTTVYVPVFDSFEANHNVVGAVGAIILWETFFSDLLPNLAESVVCVVRNGCGDVFTVEIVGETHRILGLEDFHDDRPEYNQMALHFKLADTPTVTRSIQEDFCPSEIYVYPTQDLERKSLSIRPVLFSVLCAVLFLFLACILALYENFVRRRERRITKVANDHDKIVNSIYPSSVRDRMRQALRRGSKEKILTGYWSGRATEDPVEQSLAILDVNPIADLFICSVMFAMIDGFDLWSEGRDPSQVFQLLETIFQTMDTLGRKQKIFKVETIDCSYLAVSGLPEKTRSHAIRLVQYAKVCMVECTAILRKDRLSNCSHLNMKGLDMRIGIHTGQVTAGVLQGERTRFQIFGDTVNVASRMMSTGKAGRIQLSQPVADLLIDLGKEGWIEKRKNMVYAKGKGETQTYWLCLSQLPRTAMEMVDDDVSTNLDDDCSDTVHA